MIDKKYYFGVCEWCLPAQGPLAIRMASEAGLDGIQIGDLGGAGTGFPLLDDHIQDIYLSAAAEYGITLASLHTHALTREGGMRYPIGSMQGDAAILSFKNAVKACKSLHIPEVMVASFDASAVANDYYLENTAKMLALFADIAADEGIVLSYEGVTSIDKVFRIMELADRDIKICYDIFNPIRFGDGDPVEELKKIPTELIHPIHLKDGPEYMVGCQLLGEGAGKFSETAQVIKEKGYTGWLFAETYYYQSPLKELDTGSNLMKKDNEIMRSVFK